jgi:D-alanine-D-alanine ligase
LVFGYSVRIFNLGAMAELFACRTTRSFKQSQPANTCSFDFSKQFMPISIMKIAVLFGGNSSERDVSIASGAQIAKALREVGHQVIAVDTFRGILSDQEQEALLARGVAPAPPNEHDLQVIRAKTGSIMQPSYFVDADVVFLALHGGTGEDGTIQAVFDAAGICYTGSNHIGSAAAMDKDLAKRLLVAANVRTPRWLMQPVDPELAIRDLGLPLVVKPNKQGSTVGLSVVKRAEDLPAAVALAYRHDDEVMLEQFIPGREFTVGILGTRALAVGEIIPKCSEIFDYQSKYQAEGAEEIFPADLTGEKTCLLQQLGLRVHHALKLRDYSRADFRMDEAGDFWCLEANTLPGMTALSLLPKSAAAVGIAFPALCAEICRLALSRHKAEENCRQNRGA